MSFTTDTGLSIVPARSDFIGSMIDGSTLRDHTPGMGMGVAFDCFDETPKVDDALYIGLDRPAPSNTLLLRFQCQVGGHGIDPLDPPIAWEAWDGSRWAPCFVEQDGTGGLNLSGDVDVHLPSTHAETEVGGRSQAWLRCRVVEPGERRPYRSSPKILSVDAAVIGGTVEAAHGEQINLEELGLAEGVAGQRFQVSHLPVALTAEPPVLQVRRDDEDWEDYTLVPNFADTDPDERNFTMDPRTGEVRLGPAVRLQDGSIHQYGAIPPKGAQVRLVSYRTGGGSAGNVAAGAISQLRSSIPYIAGVKNFKAASGGVDAESIDEARERGPMLLRTRNRAGHGGGLRDPRPGGRAGDRPRALRARRGRGRRRGARGSWSCPTRRRRTGRIEFRQLVPDNDTGERIQQYLDERRVVGTRLADRAAELRRDQGRGLASGPAERRPRPAARRGPRGAIPLLQPAERWP